MFVLSINIFSG